MPTAIQFSGSNINHGLQLFVIKFWQEGSHLFIVTTEIKSLPCQSVGLILSPLLQQNSHQFTAADSTPASLVRSTCLSKGRKVTTLSKPRAIHFLHQKGIFWCRILLQTTSSSLSQLNGSCILVEIIFHLANYCAKH